MINHLLNLILTKKEQLKFIEDNYPLYNNHISNRRIRHTFFDTIETELQAYLLGFYAADEKRKTLRVRYKFDICSKTITMLSDIQKVLSKNDINVNINYLKRDDMYRISTSSKSEVSKLYHYLYDDANFYLSRKFNKFSYYVNTEVSQLIADHRNAQEVNVNESNNPPTSAEHSIKE